MRRALIVGLLGLVTLLPLETTSSCAPATEDRQSPNGTRADAFGDAQHVTVYRNADDVPNVATFCLDDYGWAATLSGTDAAENKPSTLVRFPELDKTCAA
jgi:hypothetical protein